jgi:sugar phosphate isomerase/epimerase
MFPFKTALNASTLFPFALDVKQQVSVASEAGYQGIELWEKDIVAYLDTGGTISNLKAFVAGSGISIVDVMAFYPWADADEVSLFHMQKTYGFLHMKKGFFYRTTSARPVIWALTSHRRFWVASS